MVLYAVSGPAQGKTFDIGPGQLIEVGRSREMTIAITEDREMSRRHFALHCDGRLCRIRDLDSANGTWIGDVRLTVVSELRAGDRVTAGESVFVLQAARDVDAYDAATALIAESAEPPVDPDPDPEAAVMAIDNRTPYSVATLFWEDADGSPKLSVIVKATYAIEREGVIVAPAQLPVLSSDVHHGGDPLRSVRLESDRVPFKPCADIVLVGQAYAPGGRPAGSVTTALRVGSRIKTITVHGDRFWRLPAARAGRPTITQAQPFVRMELVYERAFGGIDADAATYEARNLCGTGYIGALTPASVEGKRLPNLEDADDPIRRWDARPQPAGYGYYGRGWMPRLRAAGTYDEAYRQVRAPALPKDFSYAFFNGAHPDLQVAGYLRGDEEVELLHLAPEPVWRFKLPGVCPTVRVVQRVASPEAASHPAQWRASSETRLQPLRETILTMNLDTLVLLPDERIFYAVYRGICDLSELNAAEICRIDVSA